VLDKMGNPDAVTLRQIKDAASGRGNGIMSNIQNEFFTWLSDRKNRRVIRHRLENCGYVPVRNEADKSDGQWKVGGSRVSIYAKKALSVKQRLVAATALTERDSR